MPSYRWMMFVDGENLAIRAKEVARSEKRRLEPSAHYMPDVFLWFPKRSATVCTELVGTRLHLAPHSIRSIYYTAVQGDDQKRADVEQALWDIGFNPVVFKKPAGQKAKGVDIQLTIDLLTNAFNDNYDVCVLFAGDRDYVPIIKEIQRRGKVVCLSFFVHPAGGLSTELKLASDQFVDITSNFLIECAPLST